tara:strand:- start:21 stop:290 length:270 start_codon:yes stop_codon:yes gene_type:complete
MARFTLAFCSMLLIGACAAPNRSPEGNVASAAAGTDDDPVVCETVIRTGTRLSERSCMRKSQIDAQRQASQDALQEIQRRGAQVGNPAQ